MEKMLLFAIIFVPIALVVVFVGGVLTIMDMQKVRREHLKKYNTCWINL